MKKILPLTLLALGLTVGCTQSPIKDATDNNLNNSVSFTYSINNELTKVAGSSFEVDDEISISAYENSELYTENALYSYDGSSFNSTDPIILGLEDQSLSYVAVYPYSKDLSNEYTFSTALDQSVEGAYESSDLLAAITAPSDSKSVELEFNHKLSCLEVNINSNLSLSGAVVYVNALNTVECNFADDTYVGAGEIAQIKSAKADDDTYLAVIAPQTIEVGTVLASAVINGTQYDWTTATEVVLEAGAKYSIEITAEGTAQSNLSLALNETTDSDILVDVNMNDYTGNYFVACMEKALYDAEPYNSDPVVAAGKFMYMETGFYYNSLEPGENPMVFNSSKNAISLRARWEILPEKEYIVLAFGIDSEGELTTDVQEVVTTTSATTLVDPVEISEALKTKDSFTVSAVPGATTGLYTIYAVETSQLEEYKITNDATNVDYMNSALTIYSLYGVDYSVADGEYIISGATNLQFNNMKVATTYTVLACAVSPAGVVASEINTIEITTDNAGDVDGSLTVIATATPEDVLVDVSITGEVGNYMVISMDLMTVGTEFSGDCYAAAESYVSSLASMGYTFQADDFYTFDHELESFSLVDLGHYFLPGETYYIMAFGVASDGTITTEVAYTPILVPAE